MSGCSRESYAGASNLRSVLIHQLNSLGARSATTQSRRKSHRQPTHHHSLNTNDPHRDFPLSQPSPCPLRVAAFPRRGPTLRPQGPKAHSPDPIPKTSRSQSLPAAITPYPTPRMVASHALLSDDDRELHARLICTKLLPRVEGPEGC